ncbi:MAG: DUF6438 domain-containing protein [Gammaproteobacteria bacterium]|jgi:hypothetical protein|uniref:DUF6438 domain-containing protein n=1 Tax=Nevskia sp. TaxID=1929292 RepID=UPI0040357DBA|nr:DUF6438 domain-containing protein [Gammaproteobacteria bacterium]
MKICLLFCLGVSLFGGLSACAATSPAGDPAALPHPAPAVTTTATAVQPADAASRPVAKRSAGATPAPDLGPAGFAVELQRSGCYGRCPSYRLRLDGDGTVRYFGERFVAVPGEQHGTVSSDVVAELRAQLRQPPYAALRGRYTPDDPRCGAAATDMASVRITITDAGQQRQIDHDLGCSDAPPALRALAAAIDAAAGSNRWVEEARE